MNYFKDFKRERYHDENLIELVKKLSFNNRLDILEKHFDSPELGKLESARKRRDYDVHLEFKNYCLIIETKVDSKESGNFNNWQTDKIYNKYKNEYKGKIKKFFFFTYGLSEFYIKKRSNNIHSNGAGNTNFNHFKCSDIQDLVAESLTTHASSSKRLNEWNNWLKFELNKRNDYQFYLSQIDIILKKYKSDLNLTDYPVNRLNFSTPEFTIPLYFRICSEWNKLSHQKIGMASLYALGRGSSSTNDSIINFSELRETGAITFKGLIDDYKRNTYFEFNEDFNLHLKVIDGTKNINEIRNLLEENSIDLNLEFSGTVEYYKQGSHVVYEWDLNIIENDINITLTNIEKVILNTIELIK